MPDLPPKLFFRIGEVAGLVGVEPHVLRYWEREFRSIRPTKSAKGQRVYSRKDVENLLRVRDLLYRDGFTIAGAKKKLQRGDVTMASASSLEMELEAESSPASMPMEEGSTESLDIEEENQPLAVVEVGPRSATGATPLREQLLALRGEVEDFLAELSDGGRVRSHGPDAARAGVAKRAGERP